MAFWHHMLACAEPGWRRPDLPGRPCSCFVVQRGFLCRAPMRIVSFVQDAAVIERILRHVGEPVEAPAVMPARAPPQGER